MKTKRKRMCTQYALLALMSMCLLITACINNNLAGGTTTETTNGFITGFLLNSDGTPAANVTVALIPKNYDPLTDGPIPDSALYVTGDGGEYFFSADSGMYNIEACQASTGKRLLRLDIHVIPHYKTINQMWTLQDPGAVKIKFSQNINTKDGYFYISGTTRLSTLTGESDSVFIDSLPAGMLPALIFGIQNNDTLTTIIIKDIEIFPGKISEVIYPPWKYSRKLHLNTTASGADIKSGISDFPVLVRLTSDNFNFSEAKSGGEDLRFTKYNGSGLKFEIEKWDGGDGNAAIWVNVDTIYGNNDSQYIIMVWGKTDAASESNGSGVFDDAAGFQGVWHLCQATGARAMDASANALHGTPSETFPTLVASIIGDGQQFDSSSFIIDNSAHGPLDFDSNGIYSISAWAYPDTLLKYHTVVAKGNYQYNLEIIDTNWWQFSEFSSMKGYEITTSTAVAKEWAFISGVRNGKKEYLYINGICVDSTIELKESISPQDRTFNVTIGKIIWGTQSRYFFHGKIDEVRIQNRALGADWIKLCYMNQRIDNKLVEFR